jgi:hypothetical protein
MTAGFDYRMQKDSQKKQDPLISDAVPGVPDKTYEQAIAANPSPINPGSVAAIDASVTFGRMLGAFYKELIDSGIPHDYARVLTEEYKVMVYEKVKEGMGIKG